ncbi:hypothetical protein [Paenibacillus sp.]|nr:hypothetical protein [Paenibacillus sp.]
MGVFQSMVMNSFGHQFELKQGDVVFYHAGKSSRDDFSSQVPH